MTDIDTVLEFWLGPLNEVGLAAPEQAKKWFTKDEAFDDEVRARFLATYEAISAGKHEAWLESARGAGAYVIVLDQFTRNMFRGQGRMYDSDARAVSAAVSAIDRGLDQALPPSLRTFLYMPLMHSEVLAHQDRCVALFAAFKESCAPEALEIVANHLDYAERHRKIVAEWGRFPHRNEILGRASTPEEKRFLEEPGSSF